MIECQTNYVTDCIRKTINSGHRSLEVKTKSLEKWMDLVVRTMKHNVFVSGCSAW